jgi:dimethylhistidine N-methyltransferase
MYNSSANEAASSTHPGQESAQREILVGLSGENKSINPKFFYDEYGSQLFEQITQLPEYYPTRTEMQLLGDHRLEIAAALGQGQVLIEPGAGNCSKVRLLLPALGLACYVPIDISRDFLFAAAKQLQHEFPAVPVYPIVDDMRAKITLPPELGDLPRTVFYPGSTIGNYEPADALRFLHHVREMIGSKGGLLIGVDLQKSSDILHRAYNDTQGVTALFNLNILNHVNRVIGSNFEVSRFEHVAFYNVEAGRIEIYLESEAAQTVTAGAEVFHFERGERIHTEYSYKYSQSSFAELAGRAGLVPVKNWIDKDGLFSLQYYRAI